MFNHLSIKDFDYPLPTERIAVFPLVQRDASRLLVYKNGVIQDDTFYHLPQYLASGTSLVLNNTRVLEARILFQKDSGGQIEVFCLAPARQVDPAQALAQKGPVQWECLIGGASKWKPGQVLQKMVFIDGKPLPLSASYEGKGTESFIVRFDWPGDSTFAAVLAAAGAVPLPPYIKRKAVDTDAERYQTVFAAQKGSVAAPTAALHFTDAVFANMERKAIRPIFITLHVGAGTFKPVKSESISGHSMHGENFIIRTDSLLQLMTTDQLAAGGTTSLRTLESLHWLGVKLIRDPGMADFSLSQWEAYELDQDISFQDSCNALHNYMIAHQKQELVCRTQLMIVPGYRFVSAQSLVTNFHQPCSTLLLLVAAFIGEDWKKVYNHALENGYRFLSYGDSSLLWRNAR